MPTYTDVTYSETKPLNLYENEGYLLQEDGYDILLEDGNKLLWENAPDTPTSYTDVSYDTTTYTDKSLSSTSYTDVSNDTTTYTDTVAS